MECRLVTARPTRLGPGQRTPDLARNLVEPGDDRSAGRVTGEAFVFESCGIPWAVRSRSIRSGSCDLPTGTESYRLAHAKAQAERAEAS
jgi:hypothetical protein